MPDLLRSFKDVRYSIFYGLMMSRRYPLLEMGNPTIECCWRICPNGLDARSIVYSGGVGRDITFEHQLAERFGCNVVLFDPSPTGLETMALPKNQTPRFKFHPVALAGRCGKLMLAPPSHAEEGSWFARSGASGSIEVEAVDLTTLMRLNQHERIDLLKIDIEGAEYDVLDDLLRRRLPVRQVAVEFHHANLPGIRRSQSVRAILGMRAAGYKLIDVAGYNHTFFRPRP